MRKKNGLILKKVGIKFAYGFAGLIILIAILVITSRLLTPVLGRHLPDIESEASALINMPVSIRQVHIGWYQYQPKISLDDVTILNKTAKEPVLQIREVSALFSLPKSIIQRKLVLSGIVISGSSIHVDEESNGEIGIKGLPAFSGSKTALSQHDTALADVMSWLLHLPQLVMNDIQIGYTGKMGIKRDMTLYHLRFENPGGKQHLIVGKALLHEATSTGVTLRISWEGDNVDPGDMDAKIYLFVSHFDLAAWWQGHAWQGWHVNRGIADAKIWAVWHHGTFETVQSIFDLSKLNLYSDVDHASHVIQHMRGELGFKRDGQNQIFAGEKIAIDFPLHHWPTTNFYLTMTPDQKGNLSPTALKLGYLNLDDIKTFLLASQSILPDAKRHLLQSAQLSGDIEDAAILFTSPDIDLEHISLISHFSNMHIASVYHLPGINHIAGTLHWDGREGDLTLTTRQGVIKDKDIFENRIPLDQLTGDVFWKKESNQDWMIDLKNIKASNQDIAIETNGTLLVPPSKPVVANIQANFTVQHAEHVTQYLPLRLFDAGLDDWLKQAFLSGTVSSGTALLRGSLEHFPPEGNGQFVISGLANNLHFHFAPDWPNLQNLNARVTFTNRQVKVEMTHGELGGVVIGKGLGEIPDLGNAPVLHVQSEAIHTDFSEGLRFIKESPLKETFADLLSEMSLKGPIDLKLALTIPLGETGHTAVKGDILFHHAQLELAPWDLAINQLDGTLLFTEKTIAAKNIQGELFKQPIQLDLETLQPSSPHPVTRATLKTRLSIADLENWLQVPLSSVVLGSTPVTTHVDFSPNAPTHIHLESDLVGVAVNLPEQYAKQPETPKPFSWDVVIESKDHPLRLKMQYGNLLGAALILNRTPKQLELVAADLNLGDTVPPWPAGNGLYITGKLPTLDLGTIQKYLHQSNTAKLGGVAFHNADVTIGQLQLPSFTLRQIRLQLTPLKAGFDLTVNSPDIIGTLQIPSKWDPVHSVTVQLQKLNLSGFSYHNTLSDISAASLPAFSFNAKQVSYQRTTFDQVHIQTVPKSDGLDIQTLIVSSPNLSFRATGDWTNTTTHLKGEAQSARTSEVLNGLGLDVHNFVASKGNLQFDISWHGSPFSFALASLDGQATIDIGAGRIVELSASTNAKMDLGRMLSIFSLQTIPRRLNLDFSDIFQKGYSFDVLKGDIKFLNGDALTRNAYFDGPVARVDLSGRIGLSKKDYNFSLIVTPHVTSSIPIAATILTGQPVIGIAAWAIEKVVSPTVTKATSYHYTVTGPWNNPTWKEVHR